MAGVRVGTDGVTDKGFILFVKRRVGRQCMRVISRQKPEGHLLGEYRYAIARSPCCGRRIRVRIVQRAGQWRAEDTKKCPVCRRIYRINVLLTCLGRARSVQFLSIPRWA